MTKILCDCAHEFDQKAGYLQWCYMSTRLQREGFKQFRCDTAVTSYLNGEFEPKRKR